MKTTAALQSTKRQLRTEIRSRLKKLSLEATSNQSAKVASSLLSLPCYQNSRNISIYINMPTMEVQTRDIMVFMFNQGKNCYVPRWNKDRMDMVKLDDINDLNTLPVNAWQIPEPDFSKPRETILDDGKELDLIFLPGLGFDKHCNRIGHGKGYYDKFLHEYFSKHGKYPITIGLSLTEQLVEDEIPHDKLDVKLDFVVFPDHIIENQS